MKTFNTAIAAIAIVFGASAHAQGVPVIDATANINQLQQIIHAVEQIAQLRAQYNQLESTFNSMNGIRGLGTVFNGQADQSGRRYLPPTIGDIKALAKGTGSWKGDLQKAVDIARRQVDQLPPGYFPEASVRLNVVQKTLDALATDQAVGQAAYASVGSRIATIESLIASLGLAPDQKSTQELQARIAAEQVLVQNEQTRLAALTYMQKTDQQATRVDEQRIIQGWSTTELPPIKF